MPMILQEVSREEFFKEIYDRNLDVHPSPEEHQTNWFFRDRTFFGKSTPGYLCEPYGAPHRYFLWKEET